MHGSRRRWPYYCLAGAGRLADDLNLDGAHAFLVLAVFIANLVPGLQFAEIGVHHRRIVKEDVLTAVGRSNKPEAFLEAINRSLVAIIRADSGAG